MVCVIGMSSGAGFPWERGEDWGEVPDNASLGDVPGEPGGREPLPFGMTVPPSGLVTVMAGVPGADALASWPFP